MVYYTPEESVLNGFVNGISGAIEGYILALVISVLKQSFAGFSPVANVLNVAILVLIIQTLYLLFRVSFAFIFMKRLSTVVYYFTFTATYIWFNMELGDYLSASTMFLAILVSIIVRAKIEEENAAIL
ncbi:hypothetical protein DRP04_10110 [Archaeoglobales archaeon]|nr:MAG: hypothetical protein DRP04_10110 [Archaeoglobales archaeon]